MARKILVVEDDHNISDLIRMYLEKEGFDVHPAFDGGSALELFRTVQPDMVLLDIMLPVLDGWAVCSKIRETSRTPIIMITAKSEVFDRIQGLEMGADDYIVKPFDTKELASRVKAVLRRYSAHDVQNDDETIKFENIEISKNKYELKLNGKAVMDPILITAGTTEVEVELSGVGKQEYQLYWDGQQMPEPYDKFEVNFGNG